MPPRFAYWTIIFGGQATSFRSATRDELLPTFKQIQTKHPDAQLRYFARGKLWYSDEEAQAALVRERFEKRRNDGQRRQEGFRDRDRWRPGPGGRPPDAARRNAGAGSWKPAAESGKPRGEGRPPRSGGWKPRGQARQPDAGSWRPKAGGTYRGRDWRPGGAHKDPRARFKVPRDVKRARMAKKFGWKKKKDEE